VGWRIKNFFPHPNELFICAYPKNLVKMNLMEQATQGLKSISPLPSQVKWFLY
jgi:hypothetical protein